MDEELARLGDTVWKGEAESTLRLEMVWSKFEDHHHIFFISLSPSEIAQNGIHTLLYISSQQNLDINFYLPFSDVVSYESFYIASVLKGEKKKEKEFANVAL